MGQSKASLQKQHQSQAQRGSTESRNPLKAPSHPFPDHFTQRQQTEGGQDIHHREDGQQVAVELFGPRGHEEDVEQNENPQGEHLHSAPPVFGSIILPANLIAGRALLAEQQQRAAETQKGQRCQAEEEGYWIEERARVQPYLPQEEIAPLVG